MGSAKKGQKDNEQVNEEWESSSEESDDSIEMSPYFRAYYSDGAIKRFRNNTDKMYSKHLMRT